MESKTALTQIIDFIEDNNITLMKKWSKRFKNRQLNGQIKTNSSIYGLKKKIHFILNLISGNELIPMLKSKFIVYIFKFYY